MSTLKAYKGKVATNGQVLIPKEIRESLGLKAGDAVLFCMEQQPSGALQLVVRRPFVSFKSMLGVCHDLTGRPVSTILKEIDQEDMQ